MGRVWTEAEKRAEIREIVKKYKLDQDTYCGWKQKGEMESNYKISCF